MIILMYSFHHSLKHFQVSLCHSFTTNFTFIFFYNYFKNKYKYFIKDIKNFDQVGVVEIILSLEDINKSIKNKPGQFAFFQFLEEEVKEIHPFTISNQENENKEIRLSIKALGDWTSLLKSKIKIIGHITIVRRKNNYYQLKYAKKEAIEVIKKMYYNQNVVSLSRKRIKIKKALKIEEKQQKIYLTK